MVIAMDCVRITPLVVDRTTPDKWARGHAGRMAKVVADKDEGHIVDVCNAWVGLLFATNKSFRRMVLWAARKQRVEPEEVLWTYRRKLRDHVIERVRRPFFHVKACTIGPGVLSTMH